MASTGHSGANGSAARSSNADRPDHALVLPGMSQLPGINSAARLFQVRACCILPAVLRVHMMQCGA